MSIWKKKASDLTVEEITLLSLGLGVGIGAVTYVYKETDWFETVGRKISELLSSITRQTPAHTLLPSEMLDILPTAAKDELHLRIIASMKRTSSMNAFHWTPLLGALAMVRAVNTVECITTTTPYLLKWSATQTLPEGIIFRKKRCVMQHGSIRCC